MMSQSEIRSQTFFKLPDKNEEDVESEYTWTTDNESTVTGASHRIRRIAWSDGTVYEGEVNGDYEPEGRGFLRIANGDTYDGEWQAGFMHGQGSYRLHNGGRYDGSIKGNKKSGKGRLVCPDGAIYDGDWMEDVPHGLGNFTSPSKQYSGHWKNSKADGFGTFTSIDWGSYIGSWLNDKKHGKGKVEYASGAVYDGLWDNDVAQGFGTYTWPDGGSYCGDFAKGQMTGAGVYKSPNGSIYSGEWNNNVKEGEGRLVFSDGATYDGQWKNNRPHGKGTLINPHGIMFRGVWDNGIFQSAQSGYDSRGICTCVVEGDTHTMHYSVKSQGSFLVHPTFAPGEADVTFTIQPFCEETTKCEVFESPVHPKGIPSHLIDCGYIYKTQFDTEEVRYGEHNVETEVNQVTHDVEVGVQMTSTTTEIGKDVAMGSTEPSKRVWKSSKQTGVDLNEEAEPCNEMHQVRLKCSEEVNNMGYRESSQMDEPQMQIGTAKPSTHISHDTGVTVITGATPHVHIEYTEPIRIEQNIPIIVKRPASIIVDQRPRIIVERKGSETQACSAEERKEHGSPIIVENQPPIIIDNQRPIIIEKQSPLIYERPSSPIVIGSRAPIIVKSQPPIIVETSSPQIYVDASQTPIHVDQKPVVGKSESPKIVYESCTPFKTQGSRDQLKKESRRQPPPLIAERSPLCETEQTISGKWPCVTGMTATTEYVELKERAAPAWVHGAAAMSKESSSRTIPVAVNTTIRQERVPYAKATYSDEPVGLAEKTRHIPRPVEAVTLMEFKLPRIRTTTKSIPFPVYAPRVVEVPVPMETLSDEGLALCDKIAMQVEQLRQQPTGCNMELAAEELLRMLSSAQNISGSHLRPIHPHDLSRFLPSDMSRLDSSQPAAHKT